MYEQYFRLRVSPQLMRPLKIIGLPPSYQRVKTREAFDALPSDIVAYFMESAVPEVSGVIEEPSFLVCDPLKTLMQAYLPDLQAKTVQLFAGEPESKTSCRYWLPYIEVVNCLSPQVERYPDGQPKKLILDADAVSGRYCFRVGGILEQRIIVALPVAESILRRCLYGVDLEPVEVT